MIQHSLVKYRNYIYTSFSLNNYKEEIKMFSTNSCITCGYNITDPICPKCYINQTRALLIDLKINPIINKFIIIKLKTLLPFETLNETSCILCKKENVTLCGYCFSIILTRILRELSFTEDLIENFNYSNKIYEQENETTNKLSICIKLLKSNP